jgi:hypothetical protein
MAPQALGVRAFPSPPLGAERVRVRWGTHLASKLPARPSVHWGAAGMPFGIVGISPCLTPTPSAPKGGGGVTPWRLRHGLPGRGTDVSFVRCR